MLQNKVFLTAMTFLSFANQFVNADEIFRFEHNVVPFVNYTDGNVLFLSSNGQADWMNTETQEIKSGSYSITNPKCIPYNQNTTSMDGSPAGMTLAYPFLVGLGWICAIDENAHAINLLSEFSLPTNFYSIIYAGEDEISSYFLINSKPTKGTGYLNLLSINKKTFFVSTKVFATDVPGYSGAMLYDNGDVWVTTWPSKIYKISKENFINTAVSNTSAKFPHIAQLEPFNNGMEMSLFMLKNNNSFLYFNEDYGSYTINFSNKKMSNVSLPCLPVSGYGEEWLLLCNNVSLQTWNG